VIARGQSLEHGGGKLGRAEEDGAQDQNPAASRR
jgi:hypothetical protein